MAVYPRIQTIGNSNLSRRRQHRRQPNSNQSSVQCRCHLSTVSVIRQNRGWAPRTTSQTLPTSYLIIRPGGSTRHSKVKRIIKEAIMLHRKSFTKSSHRHITSNSIIPHDRLFKQRHNFTTRTVNRPALPIMHPTAHTKCQTSSASSKAVVATDSAPQY